MKTALGPRFDEALVYAARLHIEQVRKGSDVPYVAHLLAVASLTLEDGGDEDAAVAALLHDAAEDQGGRARLVEIRDRFGAAIEAIVEACSDTLADPKPPWRPRKVAYVRRVREGAIPAGARRVMTADKLHNLRCLLADHRRLGDAAWDREEFKGGYGGTFWYFDAMCAALAAGGGRSVNLDLLGDEVERLRAAFAPDGPAVERLLAAFDRSDPAGDGGGGYGPAALEVARLVTRDTGGAARPGAEDSVASRAAWLLDRWYGDGWRREAAGEIARFACAG